MGEPNFATESETQEANTHSFSISLYFFQSSFFEMIHLVHLNDRFRLEQNYCQYFVRSCSYVKCHHWKCISKRTRIVFRLNTMREITRYFLIATLQNRYLLNPYTYFFDQNCTNLPRVCLVFIGHNLSRVNDTADCTLFHDATCAVNSISFTSSVLPKSTVTVCVHYNFLQTARCWSFRSGFCFTMRSISSENGIEQAIKQH